MPRLDKNHPTHEWINHLRARFPCESEIDSVLTRNDFEIIDANWLSGGASKLQMVFKLKWNQPGVGRTTTPMVLRMEPSESVVETSRLCEFQIIKALDGKIPVPPTYWADEEGKYLPYPAIIYGFAEGVTKPTASSSNVTGIGTSIPPDLRPVLGAQFIRHLGIVHSFDWRNAGLTSFDEPAPGTQAVEWQLNHWERVWEEDANEDVPIMRLAMAWMRNNMPPVEHISVIHGDFRTGNFLFTEHDNQISAWLDWELAHLGDRHEDLAWTTKSVFGQIAEDGKTMLVGGLAGVFGAMRALAAYEAASGLPVNRKTLQYYDIFNSYKSIAITLATGSRAARGGKTHQDVLVAWLAGISYGLLDELRTQLEEVL
jgi:aminoglycoside phosphotransferase (APT) family kinase protein